MQISSNIDVFFEWWEVVADFLWHPGRVACWQSLCWSPDSESKSFCRANSEGQTDPGSVLAESSYFAQVANVPVTVAFCLKRPLASSGCQIWTASLMAPKNNFCTTLKILFKTWICLDIQMNFISTWQPVWNLRRFLDSMRLLKTVLQKSNPLAAWWHSVLQPTKMHKAVQNHRNQWMLPLKNRTLLNKAISDDMISFWHLHFWMILDDLGWSSMIYSHFVWLTVALVVTPGLCPCGISRWSSLRAWPSHCHVLGQIQWGVSGISGLSGVSSAEGSGGRRFRAAWWHLKKALPQFLTWYHHEICEMRLGRNFFFYCRVLWIELCSRFWFEQGSWSPSWLSSMMIYYEFYHEYSLINMLNTSH